MVDISPYNNDPLHAYAEGLRSKYLRNRNVLLVQALQFLPYSTNLEVIFRKGYPAWPPTGIQRIANALAGRGLNIKIVDLNYETLEHVFETRAYKPEDSLEILDRHIAEVQPSIIGVSCICMFSDLHAPTNPLTMLLDHLKKLDRFVVVAGGTALNNDIGGFLRREMCHFAVAGEGEDKVRYLMDVLLDDGGKAAPRKGIYFKPADRLEQTDGGTEWAVLTGDLIGTYQSLPIEKYHRVGCLNTFSRFAGMDRPYGVLQLNRGCRARCLFCGVPKFMGRPTRHYPVAEVLAEVRYQVEERGIRHLDVIDDDFIGDRRTTSELIQGLIDLRARYDFTWSAYNGLIASQITEDLLELLRKAGCIGFSMGIESGNPDLLRRTRKPSNLRALRKASDMLQRFPELFVVGNYILGLYDEETFGQMLDSFRFTFEMKLDWSAFAAFQITSFGTAVELERQSDVNRATHVLPARDRPDGEVAIAEGVLAGPDVFRLDPDKVPARRQISQIWFTFNLVSNYIGNKHLRPGGDPAKYVAWVETIQGIYPANPYMPLFAALGRRLMQDHARVPALLEIARTNVDKSDYWRTRFEQFDLMSVLENFPDSAPGAAETLEAMRERYAPWMEADGHLSHKE